MKRPATIVAFAYFIAMTIGCTFPFLGIVNRVRPFVLGLPFMMVWFAAWILGAMAVFGLLYQADRR
jgi:hypothetical protein